MQQSEQPGGVKSLLATVSEYLKLLIEDTRLTLFLLLTIVITVAMVFLSIAVSVALSVALRPLWAFIIVAGFYIVLLAVLFFGRKILIVNPIARFISSILIDPPADKNTEEDV